MSEKYTALLKKGDLLLGIGVTRMTHIKDRDICRDLYNRDGGNIQYFFCFKAVIHYPFDNYFIALVAR